MLHYHYVWLISMLLTPNNLYSWQILSLTFGDEFLFEEYYFNRSRKYVNIRIGNQLKSHLISIFPHKKKLRTLILNHFQRIEYFAMLLQYISTQTEFFH